MRHSQRAPSRGVPLVRHQTTLTASLCLCVSVVTQLTTETQRHREESRSISSMSTTPIPPEWRTHAELTDYSQTPNYDDTVAYARRLAHASPAIDYEGFGQSGEGRELPLLIASETGAFTPEAAR